MRSKLTLLVLSAILVGGAGAVLAGMSAIQPPSYAALAANNSSGATNTTGSASTATTAGHSASATSTASAAPTNTSVPTPRPTRTPTPIPVVGQPLTVRGDVTSVDTNAGTFMVNVGGGGGTYTITVSSTGTNWTGPIANLSVLNSDTPTPGARATVTGTYRGNGALDATSAANNGTVYAFIDN